MNNIDELIELNLYEPISRYLTVLEEENDIIKNLTIKILLSLKAVDDVLRYNCNNEYHFYIKDDVTIYNLLLNVFPEEKIKKKDFDKAMFILDFCKLIYRFTCAKKFKENNIHIFQLRLNSWGREYVQNYLEDLKDDYFTFKDYLGSLIKRTDEEDSILNKAIEEGVNWIEVGGILLNHRLSGYFYNNVSNQNLQTIPEEMRKNLKALIKGQEIEQIRLSKYIKEIDAALKDTSIKYAGLKGIIFGAGLYKAGVRRSNDIDLLVYEEDLDKLDCIFRKIGYIQSLLPDGKLIEASRKEKVIQRMNYHDLVPYVKMESDGMVVVDINFLFDSKDNLVDGKVFNRGLHIYNGENYSFKGLDIESNLAFLIVHFYREAVNDIWIKDKRNLVLYKIVDIINYIRFYYDKIDIYGFCDLLDELNIIEKAIYTFFIIREYYNDAFIKNCLEIIAEKHEDIYKKLEQKQSNYITYHQESFKLGE